MNNLVCDVQAEEPESVCKRYPIEGFVMGCNVVRTPGDMEDELYITIKVKNESGSVWNTWRQIVLMADNPTRVRVVVERGDDVMVAKDALRPTD